MNNRRTTAENRPKESHLKTKLGKKVFINPSSDIAHAVKYLGLNSNHPLVSLSSKNHSSPQLKTHPPLTKTTASIATTTTSSSQQRPLLRAAHTQPNLNRTTPSPQQQQETSKPLLNTPNHQIIPFPSSSLSHSSSSIPPTANPSPLSSPHPNQLVTPATHHPRSAPSIQNPRPQPQPLSHPSSLHPQYDCTSDQPSNSQLVPPSTCQQPQLSVLPTIRISGIERSIDYTQAIDDILHPPPNFTTPSFPPPVGSPPAARPSDISFGYLGRPNSPPPSYPQLKTHDSEGQRRDDDSRCSSENEDEARDSNPDWDLNLSLENRISDWLDRRGCSQRQLSNDRLSSSLVRHPPQIHLIHQQLDLPQNLHVAKGRKDSDNDMMASYQYHQVQSSNIVWVPIRLIMDESYGLKDTCDNPGNHLDETSNPDNQTLQTSLLKVTEEEELEEDKIKINRSISSNNEAENNDQVESSSLTGGSEGSTGQIPTMSDSDKEKQVCSALSGDKGDKSGQIRVRQSFTSHDKGKDVDRAEQPRFTIENHYPSNIKPATTSRPHQSRPLPPLPPRRLDQHAQVHVTRKPPPPVPPKPGLTKAVEKSKIGGARRPPPLPPKQRLLHQGPPQVSMNTHCHYAPTSLPASPAEVNQMLRRGSSLRSKDKAITSSNLMHNHHQRQLSLSSSEDLFEEEQAFNRRSLPVIVELNSLDSSHPPPSPSFIASSASAHQHGFEVAQQQLPPRGGGNHQDRDNGEQAGEEEGPAGERERATEVEQRLLSDYTELDLLLLRIERSQNDGNDYEDLNLLQEILGQHSTPGSATTSSSNGASSFTIPNYEHQPRALNHHHLTSLQSGNIQLVSKRTDKFGKVKLKFSLLGNRCNKCVICLHQFKADEPAVILPCTHVFHQGCIIHWFKIKKQCPLCKLDLLL